MKIRVPNSAALKLAISFGILGAVSAIPAAAGTLNLNTGVATYTIFDDTLSSSGGPIGTPGDAATLVTNLGSGWSTDLTPSSAWIGPAADELHSNAFAAGYVTYLTTFSLPADLDPGSTISITFLADDWSTVTLNNSTFYTGPSGCQTLLSNPLNFCSSDPTSWLTPTILTVPDGLLASGTNTLSFTVWNTGGGNDVGCCATGLDAQVAVNYTDSGSPAPTPEPPTAFTFASALAVGLAFWRLQPGRQTAS
jgi:hypothetical protein